MRINNLNLQGVELKDNLKLREGMTVRGEIVSISDDTVLINIKGYGNLEVDLKNVDIDLESFLGEMINFLIQDIEDSTITLKVLLDNAGVEAKTEENNLVNILKNLKIPDTEDNREIVKLLMENNIPLNDKNLVEVLKNFNKLLDLSNLSEEENVELVNIRPEIEKNVGKDEQIKTELPAEKLMEKPLESPKLDEITKNEPEKILDKSIVEDEKVVLKENEAREIGAKEELVLNENKEALLNSDIKNILVFGAKGEKIENMELKQALNQLLEDGLNIGKDDIKKMFTFFAKNEIKPTLNNVLNFIEFSDNPTKFIKQIMTERNRLFEKLGMDEKTSEKITVNMLKDEINNIKDKFGLSQNLREEFRSLDHKLSFINEMNKDMSFMFLPIHTEMEKYKGLISLLKEKEKRSMDKGKVNVFIDLNTHNLGNVKISCVNVGESLSISLQIGERDLNLFKENESELVERIEKIGYNVSSINYLYSRDLHVMDDLVNEKNTNYFLDIKV